MKKKGVWFLLILIVIVAWWWLLQGRADAAPEAGVLNERPVWGDESDRWQACFDGFGLPDDALVRVRSRARNADLLEVLCGNAAPGLPILSNAELVRSHHEQGLVEPLVRWTEAAGISLETIYLVLLQIVQDNGSEYLCLP